MRPKYHVRIGKCLKKAENHMTEIQRQLDDLYQISNRLYELDSVKPVKTAKKSVKKRKKSRRKSK